jgi:hypothetical protein
MSSCAGHGCRRRAWAIAHLLYAGLCQRPRREAGPGGADGVSSQRSVIRRKLTRINAGYQLFSVPLTGITSVPGVCRFARGIPAGIGLRVSRNPKSLDGFPATITHNGTTNGMNSTYATGNTSTRAAISSAGHRIPPRRGRPALRHMRILTGATWPPVVIPRPQLCIHRGRCLLVAVSRPGCLRLAEVGSNLIDPAVDEREEALDATVGQFPQRDFRPLAAQDILTIKAWYPQGLQVCGQALASMLAVIWRRIAHLIDPDLKSQCHLA